MRQVYGHVTEQMREASAQRMQASIKRLGGAKNSRADGHS